MPAGLHRPRWWTQQLLPSLHPLLQAAVELEARQAGEVSRLKDAIAGLEKGERQLLKARALLEARGLELEAALDAARQEAAAEAEASRLAVATAVAAANTDLQQQVWLGPDCSTA